MIDILLTALNTMYIMFGTIIVLLAIISVILIAIWSQGSVKYLKLRSRWSAWRNRSKT